MDTKEAYLTYCRTYAKHKYDTDEEYRKQKQERSLKYERDKRQKQIQECIDKGLPIPEKKVGRPKKFVSCPNCGHCLPKATQRARSEDLISNDTPSSVRQETSS